MCVCVLPIHLNPIRPVVYLLLFPKIRVLLFVYVVFLLALHISLHIFAFSPLLVDPYCICSKSVVFLLFFDFQKLDFSVRFE